MYGRPNELLFTLAISPIRIGDIAISN